MTKRRTLRRRTLRSLSSRKLHHETLEKRELLAAEFGDLLAQSSAPGDPILIAVAPNSGELFDLDPQDQLSNVRLQAPTELQVTFGGAEAIDPGTLSGAVSVAYSESGNFGVGSTSVPIGYIGLDDAGRSATIRFSDHLADGFYQLSITSALEDVTGTPFVPRFPEPVPGTPGLLRDVISFEVELGAKVIAVTPQPIEGGVIQANRIDVYFDDADLFRAGSLVGDPSFYQLVDTQNTVTTEDDMIYRPPTGADVVVDAANRKVSLLFGSDLDALVDQGDVLRLRIGDNTDFTAIDVVRHFVGSEPGLTSATAETIPAAASGNWSVVVGQTISNVGLPQLVDNPGGIQEPGHRDIEVEDHFISPGSRDSDNGITTIPYTFLRNSSYGSNSQGDPLFNQMDADQELRFREILDLYSTAYGIDFFETESSGLKLIVGDLSTADPTVESGPGGVAGLGGPGGVTMDAADFLTAESNRFGGSFFGVGLHEIGHAIGLGHSYDLPPGTIQGSSGEYPDSNRPGPGTEAVYPGDNDLVHGRYLHQKESLDVDLYRVDVTEAGVLKSQTFAQRLPDSTLLDSRLSVFREDPLTGKLELVAANDDYFGSDSFVELAVEPGVFFVGVSAEGNSLYDPDSGLPSAGGTSQGGYELRVDFTSEAATAMSDADGSLLDGDRDGTAGGNYDFWFEPVDPNTIYVNKDGGPAGDGSFANPFDNIPSALIAAEAAIVAGLDGVVVRLLPSAGPDNAVGTVADNIAYEIGRVDSLNQTLDDGRNLELPTGVNLTIDAGVILKFLDSRISVGSDDDGNDRSEASISVQGIPGLPVYFTSFNDTTLGSNSNVLNPAVAAGDWGGIEIRNDVDRLQGRADLERMGLFQNYINNAEFFYGGGEVTTIGRIIDPIFLSQARAEISFNTLRLSADAPISADPNTFEITTFTEPRFQRSSVSGNAFVADYGRVGPSIYGNVLVDNSTNGLFVRVDTPAGGGLETLQVPARFDDTDIVHVLGESLLLESVPGGPVEDSRRAAPIIGLATASGGDLDAGAYRYSYTFVDAFGFESPSSASQPINVAVGGTAVNLTDIPAATGKYVGRRLYRSVGGGQFRLVAELDKSSQDYTDTLQTPSSSAAVLSVFNTRVLQGRIGASLIIDPGTIIKNQGARIELGFGTTLLAEGREGGEIIFTSRSDDRYGAGGSFDSDGNGVTFGSPGDWAGIYAAPNSRLSVDQALVAFAGGVTGVSDGTASFNPIQVHQADARIANTLFEDNANGVGSTQGNGRRSFAPNGAATIYVTASQPSIVGNSFVDNQGAVISINVNALNVEFNDDSGRQTGPLNRFEVPPANNGPVVRGNRLEGNGINGMVVRGEVLNTEVVWDDTDIVHVLQRDIEIPDLHTFGGMRLESSSTESLVVKVDGAEILATGRALDITDRIGGRLHVIGQPGFPVIMTSINDDTVGAGYTPGGLAQSDTIAGAGTASPGDWQGLRFDPYSLDRNVAVVTEREGFGDTNATIGSQQDLGLLAADEKSGDENIRLGFKVHGAISTDNDVDLYSFAGVAGTMVWIDIDQTDPQLDTVLELIDGNGNVLALSQDSRAEAAAGQLTYTDPTRMRDGHALPMELDPDAPHNADGSYRDLYTTNDGDSAVRVVLPGTAGTRNTFYVRVRSNNSAFDMSTLTGISDSLAVGGTTRGGYQMQIRLQEVDEFAGSVVRYADLRYATSAIVATGLPANSPLTGELFNPGGLLDLGTLANTNRGAISVAGEANDTPDIYTFGIDRDSLQGINPTDNSLGIVIDVDWADGLTRPNTNAYLFDGNRLIAIGTDSNVSDDRVTPIAPGQPTTETDLARGSFGARDAFIGPLELSPDGNYQLVIGTDGQMPADLTQFTQISPANTLTRLEPLDPTVRIIDDRFDYRPGERANDTPVPTGPEGPVAIQVGFADDGSNIIPLQFGDISLITLREDANSSGAARLSIYNPFTGRHDAIIEDFTSAPLSAVAQSARGDVIAIRNEGDAQRSDANTSTTYSIDVEGSVTPIGATGIQTYEYNGANVVANVGLEFTSLAFYNDTDTQTRYLYGLANRGDFDGSLVVPDANGVDTLAAAPGRNGDNLVYLLDPDTGTAISRRGTDMLPGFESSLPTSVLLRDNFGGTTDPYFPGETAWGGTNIVAQIQIPTRSPNTNGNTGNVTSLVTDADGGTFLYAFTDRGAVWRMAIEENTDDLYTPGDLRGAPVLVFDPTLNAGVKDSNGTVIAFEQVTQGPANFVDVNDTEGLRDLFFGVGGPVGSGQTRFYAFDVATGNARPVFEFGGDSVEVDNRGAAGAFAGLFFSVLDQSLGHVSDTLRSAPGHGFGALDDRPAEIGGGSIRFGFDELNNDFNHLSGQNQDGDDGIVSDNSDGNNDLDAVDIQNVNGYNFLGGAFGSVQSNQLDLSGVSADDLPTLYFTYLLDTENTNADDNAPAFNDDGLDDVMRDSLRVSVAGDDGVWRLVATNNITDSINGRVWEDSRGNVQEYDPVGSLGYADLGDQRFVQELFDGTDFRQARIDLGPWAGQEDVKIRFDFSTAGEARPDQSEIQANPGEEIVDGQSLFISGQMPDRNATDQGDSFGAMTKRFEFDLGLVVQMPGGSQVTSPLTLRRPDSSAIIELLPDGSVAGPGQVVVLSSDSAADVADRVQGAIGGTTRSPGHQEWVSFPTEVAAGAYSFDSLPGFVVSQPGVSGGAVAINVDISDTAIDVRDAIQLSLANEIRYRDAAPSLAAFPVVGNTNSVRVYDLQLAQPAFGSNKPLTLINGQFAGGATPLPGQDFGVYTGGTSVRDLLRAGERSRGLGGDNGVYIDDIVIGLADRGESITGATQGTALVNNPYFEALFYDASIDATRPLVEEITRGEYQLEVRLGREYLGSDNEGKDHRIGLNERLVKGLDLVVTSTGADLVDGDTFDLSNGFETITFEFNDVTPGSTITPITPGNVSVNYRLGDTAGELANAIRGSINQSSVRSVLGVEALSRGGDRSDATDQVIQLHGFAAADNLGGIDFTSLQSGKTHLFGAILGGDVVLGEDNGDRNLTRDQGVFIVDSNIISFSSGTAINVSAGSTAPGNKVPNEGARPKPGAAQNLRILSNEQLVAGAVVQNNLLISNRDGIVLAGNPSQGGPDVYSRILNNTIYNSNVGIAISNRAAPTLLNNALIDNNTGIRGQNEGSTVIRGTVYDGNGTNVSGVSLGTEAIVNPAGPLFLNPNDANFNLAAGSPNFYPAAGSAVIDKGIASQLDRATIVSVKDAVGIPKSPVVVTDRDLAGQIRASGSNSSGQGSNVNIDIGALDRSDNTGPQAQLIVPTDNGESDIDRELTFLQLTEGVFNFFDILISEDSGIAGPDLSTITADQVLVLENRRRLIPGTEVIVSYSSGNHTLRLTSPSGLWRTDAVYEIVLLNEQITLPDGTVLDPIADLAGNPLQPNRPDGQTRFTIVMPDIKLDYGDAPASYNTLSADNGPRHSIADQFTPRLGRYVDGETDSELLLADDGDDILAALTIDGNNQEAGDGPFTIAADVVTGDVTVTLTSNPVAGDNLSVTAGRETVVFELIEGGGTVAVGSVAVGYPVGATLPEIMDRLSQVMATTLPAMNVQAIVNHSAGTAELALAAQDDEDGVSIGTFTDGLTDYTVFTQPGTDPANIQADDVLGFLNPLDPSGTDFAIDVVGTGLLQAWIDFDQSGTFDADEQVLTNVPADDVSGSTTIYTINTPADASVGQTRMRVRFSQDPDLAPTGLAVGGEVEDYIVEVIPVPLPVPADDNYEIDEDATLDTLAAGLQTIGDNDTLPSEVFLPVEYIVTNQPTNGTLTSFDIVSGDFVYVPSADFNGVDTFTYRTITQESGRINGALTSPVGTVTISILPVNDPPVASNQSLTVLEDIASIIPASRLLQDANGSASPPYTSPSTDPLEIRNQFYLNEGNQVLSVVAVQGSGGLIDASNAAGGGNVVVTKVGTGLDLTVSDTSEDLLSLTFGGTTVTFELIAFDGTPQSGTVVVPIFGFDTTSALANRLRDAIDTQFSATLPSVSSSSGGSTISLAVDPVALTGAVSGGTFAVTPGALGDSLAINVVGTPSAGDTVTVNINSIPVVFELVLEGDSASGSNIAVELIPFADPASPAAQSSAAAQLEAAMSNAAAAAGIGLYARIEDGATNPLRVDLSAASIGAGKSFATDRGNAIPLFNDSGALIELRYINTLDLNRDNDPGTLPNLDEFTFIVGDDGIAIDLVNNRFIYGPPLESSPGTASITVAPQNDPPVLTSDLVSVGPLGPDASTVTTDWELFGGGTPTEDQTLQIDPAFLLANDFRGRMAAADEDAGINDLGLVVTAVAMVDPTQGRVSLANGVITFTPAADIFGDILFTYTAQDRGINETETGFRSIFPLSTTGGIVTVSVQPVNDVPLAFDRALSFTESSDPGAPAAFVFTRDQLINGAAGESSDETGDFDAALPAPFNESEQSLRVVSFSNAAGSVDVSSLNGVGLETLSLASDSGGLLEFDFVDGIFTEGRFNSVDDYNRRTPFDATDAFTYVISDDGLTTSPQGGGQFNLPDARSDDAGATPAAVTLTVLESNDAPTFSISAPIVAGLPTLDILERDDNGTTIIDGFALNVLPGPTTALDETARQNVVFSFPPALNPSSNVPAGLMTQLPTLTPSGQLSLFPAPDAIGTATYVVVATDVEPGTPGFAPRTTTATFVVNVQPVNDAPRFDPNVAGTSDMEPGNRDEAYSVGRVDDNNDGLIDSATITYTLREDNTQAGGGIQDYFIPLNAAASAGYSRIGLLDVFTAGPDNESGPLPGGSQIVELLQAGNDPVAPSLDRTTDRGGILTPVFDINNDLIGLNYRPPLDFNASFAGVDSFTYFVRDDSTTGGETYDLNTGALISDRLTSQNRVELFLNPVNDRPEFTTETLNINVQEDSSEVRFLNYASNITAGPPNTAFDEVDINTGELVDFSITPLDFPLADAASFFSIYPTIDERTGLLNFQPLADAFGEYRFEIVLNDRNRDGSVSDDINRGELNSSIPVTLTIDVRPVNDPPVVDPNADILAFTILEDGVIDVLVTGDGTSPGLLDPFLPGPSVGPTDESADILPRPGGNQTVSLGTPLPRTSAEGGSVQFINTGGAPRFRYTPRANFIGMDQFIYTVVDDGITVGVDGVPFSDPRISANTVTFEVLPVNDAPLFSGAGNVQSLEDQGLVTVTDWATNVQAGPTTAFDETVGSLGAPPQSLQFEFTQISSNTNLFLTPPTAIIDPLTGTAALRFEANPDANGLATFEVVLKDNGPQDAGIGDEFVSDPPRRFFINVQAVNDPPTFDLASDTILREEDSGPFNVTQAINISPGPVDELTQSVAFEVQPLAPEFASLFVDPPTISPDGLLRFTPAPNQNTDNANGPAVISVIARDSEGAESAAVSFQIAVSEVNDPPRAFSDSIDTDEDTLLLINEALLKLNDVDPDLATNVNEVVRVVMPATAFSLSGALVTFDESTGVITYDPSGSLAVQSLAPGQTLTDSFAYSLIDAAGARSNLVTVALNVSGINDAPIVVADTPQLNRDGSTIIPVLANDTDVDGVIVPGTIRIELQPAFGSVSILPDGTLSYTPFSSFSQEDVFSYSVADNSGDRSVPATVTVGSNARPIAMNDARGTFLNEAIDINVSANDIDPDGTLDLASIEIVTSPIRGQAVPQADGTVRYLPDVGFLGRDFFEYRISDTEGGESNVARVDTQVVASRLQNPDMRADVNDDGFVSAIDALLIINHLTRTGGDGSIPVLPTDRGPNFYDVNGNQQVTAGDALVVINTLAETNSGEGEQLPLATQKVEAGLDTVVDPASDDLSGPTKIVGTDIADSVPTDVIDLIAASRDAEEEDSLQDAIDAVMNDVL